MAQQATPQQTMVEVGDLIRAARESRGLTQDALAKKVGTKQQTIGKIEKGQIEFSRFHTRIATELGINFSNPTERPAADLGGPAADLGGDVEGRSPVPIIGGRDLPVYAAAEAGKGQIIVSTDPVDWDWRAAPLSHVKGAYALIIIGDSMVPEYEPGDTALVNPTLPPIRDVTCIFYTEKHGEARATIKRLIRVTEEHWHVRQWNPPEGASSDFKLARKEWPTCHRVVGKHARR
jgi:phage repressor protein C with HTH and peptisase S24 domain